MDNLEKEGFSTLSVPLGEELDLLDCPFCGSTPRVTKFDSGECVIGCEAKHCDVQPSVKGSDRKTAMRAWNKRR